MHGVTVSPLSGSSIIKAQSLIIFLIIFKVYFNQDFLTRAGYMVTSEEFLGSGMKHDTSDLYSTKVGNELLN